MNSLPSPAKLNRVSLKTIFKKRPTGRSPPQELTALRNYIKSKSPALTVTLEKNVHTIQWTTQNPDRTFLVKVLYKPPRVERVAMRFCGVDYTRNGMTISAPTTDSLINESERRLEDLLDLGNGFAVQLFVAPDAEPDMVKTIKKVFKPNPRIRTYSCRRL